MKVFSFLKKLKKEQLHSFVAVLFLVGGFAFSYALVYTTRYIFNRDVTTSSTVVVASETEGDANGSLALNGGYDLKPEEYEVPDSGTAATVTFDYTVDDNGEVKGSSSCVTGTSFNYDKQFSCYPDSNGDRACIQGEDEDGDGFVDGICYNSNVTVEIVEIWAPNIMYSGEYIENLQSEKQRSWAVNGAIAPCYDKATGNTIEGISCYNNLGTGGAPVFNYQYSTYTKNTPPYGMEYSAKELQDTYSQASANEADFIGWSRLGVSGADTPNLITFTKNFDLLSDGNTPIYKSSNPNDTVVGANTPIVANRFEDKYAISYSAPFEDTSRNEEVNECSAKASTLLDSAYHIPAVKPISQPVKCITPVAGKEVADMDLERKALSWVKCLFDKSDPGCAYTIVKALEVQSNYGTAYNCASGQCSSRNYDQQIAWRVDPFNSNLQVPGITPSLGNPTYSMQYVTTKCIVKIKDYSKSPFPKAQLYPMKCAYYMPHTRQIQNINLSTMYSHYSSDTSQDAFIWMENAINDAKESMFTDSESAL